MKKLDEWPNIYHQPQEPYMQGWREGYYFVNPEKDSDLIGPYATAVDANRARDHYGREYTTDFGNIVESFRQLYQP